MGIVFGMVTGLCLVMAHNTNNVGWAAGAIISGIASFYLCVVVQDIVRR